MPPSEAEIGAIDAEGETTVVSLVDQLLEHLNRLEAKVEELQEHLKKKTADLIGNKLFCM